MSRYDDWFDEVLTLVSEMFPETPVRIFTNWGWEAAFARQLDPIQAVFEFAVTEVFISLDLVIDDEIEGGLQ